MYLMFRFWPMEAFSPFLREKSFFKDSSIIEYSTELINKFPFFKLLKAKCTLLHSFSYFYL